MNFALGGFTPMKINKYVIHNVRKNIEITDSDKYITLDISLEFGSLENTRITHSEPKDN